jgi:type III restriction enzyme
MKIKFKEQKFQLEAVQAVVDCFKGQINETSKFTLDRGRTKADLKGQTFFLYEEGFKNKSISLPDIDILENIKKVQLRNGLKPSDKLEGKYNLTIEMETGERVIIVMGAINVFKSRVSETLNKYNSCIA